MNGARFTLSELEIPVFI